MLADLLRHWAKVTWHIVGQPVLPEAGNTEMNGIKRGPAQLAVGEDVGCQETPCHPEGAGLEFGH